MGGIRKGQEGDRMRIIRECGGYNPAQTCRFFEFEDDDGLRRFATESWLRKRGVDPDVILGGGGNSVHGRRDVRSDYPQPVRGRRRRRQADGVGGATLF